MGEPGGQERPIRQEKVQAKTANRTGIEDILFAGSSYKLSDTEGYGAPEAVRDLHKGLPDFMLKTKNATDSIEEINKDRENGTEGYLPVFENIHSRVKLPLIDDTRIPPTEWRVTAGKDGKEAPILEQYYGDLVELQDDNGEYTLRIKNPNHDV